MRDPTQSNAHLQEAREDTTNLRRIAEPSRAEADERLTRKAIAECRRAIEALEEAKAFWLKVLQESLQASSRSRLPAVSVGDVADPSLRLGEGQVEVETPDRVPNG